jgi:hypothetical protein
MIESTKGIEQTLQAMAALSKEFVPPANVAPLIAPCLGYLVFKTLERLSVNLDDFKEYKLRPGTLSTDAAGTSTCTWQAVRAGRKPPSSTVGDVNFFRPDHYTSAVLTAKKKPRSSTWSVCCSKPKCNQTEEPCVHLLALQCGTVGPEDFGVLKQNALFTGEVDLAFWRLVPALAAEMPGQHNVGLRIDVNKHGAHSTDGGSEYASNGHHVSTHDSTHDSTYGGDSMHDDSMHTPSLETNDAVGAMHVVDGKVRREENQVSEQDLDDAYRIAKLNMSATNDGRQDLLARLQTAAQEYHIQTNPNATVSDARRRKKSDRGRPALKAKPHAGSASGRNDLARPLKRPPPPPSSSPPSSPGSVRSTKRSATGITRSKQRAHSIRYHCCTWANGPNQQPGLYFLVDAGQDRFTWKGHSVLEAKNSHGVHTAEVGKLEKSHPGVTAINNRVFGLPCAHCGVDFSKASNKPGDTRA